MKKVLISQRVDLIDKYQEVRDSVDQKLIDWILSLGFIPILVSNKLVSTKIQNCNNLKNQNKLSTFLQMISPDAIILSGGNNIGQFRCRDITEYLLLNWAKDKKIPLLGICRGMQIMSVWSKVKLIKVYGHVNTRKKLKIIDPHSNWPVEVNSFHNWAISKCPKGYAIQTISYDDIIKSIKHQTLPWEGWMWHPEREHIFSEIDNNRLKALFSNE